MKPFDKNLTIRRGDTSEVFFRIRERVFDDATQSWIPGAYRDLTGWSVLSQVRTRDDASTLLLEYNAVIGDQTDLVNGVGSVLLHASPSQTSAIDPALKGAVWDCQLTDPGGDTYTYISGVVTLAKDVSRNVS